MAHNDLFINRPDLEQIIIDHEQNGLSYQKLIKKYGGSLGAYSRFFQQRKSQIAMKSEANLDELGEVRRKIKIIEERSDELYQMAKKEKNPKMIATALKTHKEILELYGKLTGELNKKTEVVHQHLHLSPEWLDLRACIITALQGYPEARKAVTGAIKAVTEHSEVNDE